MLKKESQPLIARSVIGPFNRADYCATKRLVGKTNHWHLRNKRTMQKQQQAFKHEQKRRKGQRRARSNHWKSCRKYKGNWKKPRRCRANRGKQKNFRRRGRSHRKSLKCKRIVGKKGRKGCRKADRPGSKKRRRGGRMIRLGMQHAAKAPLEMSLPPSLTVATASHTDQIVSPPPNQVLPKSNTNTNSNTNSNSNTNTNSLQMDANGTKKPLSVCEEAVASCCSTQWSTFGETARCFELNNCPGINFESNICFKLPEVIKRIWFVCQTKMCVINQYTV